MSTNKPKQAALVKFTFCGKEGKQRWLSWVEDLKARQKEVYETLRAEGVLLEANFLSEDGNAVYYLIIAESLANAYNVCKNSLFPIDHEHKAAKAASFSGRCELEPLFIFTLMNGNYCTLKK